MSETKSKTKVTTKNKQKAWPKPTIKQIGNDNYENLVTCPNCNFPYTGKYLEAIVVCNICRYKRTEGVI